MRNEKFIVRQPEPAAESKIRGFFAAVADDNEKRRV